MMKMDCIVKISHLQLTSIGILNKISRLAKMIFKRLICLIVIIIRIYHSKLLKRSLNQMEIKISSEKWFKKKKWR